MLSDGLQNFIAFAREMMEVLFIELFGFCLFEVSGTLKFIILMSDAICNFRLFCFECEYMESRVDSSLKMSLVILYVLVIK